MGSEVGRGKTPAPSRPPDRVIDHIEKVTGFRAEYYGEDQIRGGRAMIEYLRNPQISRSRFFEILVEHVYDYNQWPWREVYQWCRLNRIDRYGTFDSFEVAITKDRKK